MKSNIINCNDNLIDPSFSVECGVCLLALANIRSLSTNDVFEIPEFDYISIFTGSNVKPNGLLVRSDCRWLFLWDFRKSNGV